MCSAWPNFQRAVLHRDSDPADSRYSSSSHHIRMQDFSLPAIGIVGSFAGPVIALQYSPTSLAIMLSSPAAKWFSNTFFFPGDFSQILKSDPKTEKDSFAV
jgi:hypothetical protein